MVLLNYKLFKSNIIISFLLDELIIVCLLVYIDYFMCCILISVDFFDEGNYMIMEGGRWYKMIYSNIGRY